MPIHIGTSTKNQQQISLGITQMQKVFVGDNLVWQKSTPMANSKYGLLYNWYAATDSRGFVSGFHVPTIEELQTLDSYIGSNGGKLKEVGYTHWNNPNVGATNEVGFNGRGAGRRTPIFNNLLSWCELLSISEVDADRAYKVAFRASSTSTYFYDTYALKTHGHTLRLICDSTTDPGFIDIDGKRYLTVKIGDQVWMAENLKAEHFAEGTAISEVTDGSAWAALTTPGLCAYNNDWSNV